MKHKKFKSPQQTIAALSQASSKLLEARELIHSLAATLLACSREGRPPTDDEMKALLGKIPAEG